MTLNTQPQPIVQSGRSCLFGQVARLFYNAWGEKALMRFAPTRQLDDQ